MRAEAATDASIAPSFAPARLCVTAFRRGFAPIDTAVIALLNVMLAIEVVLVFAGTMVRTLRAFVGADGVDELSPLFLVTLAFMGGAVAYSRGQFIAITMLVDRAPRERGTTLFARSRSGS